MASPWTPWTCAHASDEPEIWEEAVNKLRGGLMPPAGQKQPSQADVDAFVGFLETSLDSSAKPRIGHVPLQRLNRTEFAASIKELLGVDIDTKAALPTEVEVEGFSNIASALGVSPAFLEQYMAVTRKAVKLALGEPVPKMAKVTITNGGQAPPTAYPLGTRGAGGGRGGMSFTLHLPGRWRVPHQHPEEDYIDMGLYPRGAEHPATMVILHRRRGAGAQADRRQGIPGHRRPRWPGGQESHHAPSSRARCR